MESTGTGVVDRTGDKFFASTTLAGDEYRGVGGADGLDGIENAFHGDALADDVIRSSDLRDSFTKTNVLLFSTFVSEGFLHQMSDFVRIERLGDVVVGAVLEGGDSGVDRGVSGHHDDCQVGVKLVDAALQFYAVGAAHFNVEQGHVPALFGQAGQRVICVFGGSDFVTFLAEPLA